MENNDAIEYNKDMKEVSASLVQYAEQDLLPLYRDADKAHDLDHVRQVIKNSLEIAQEYDCDIDMVYAIAVYHDLGVLVDRERHEFFSGQKLIADKELSRWFTPEKIRIMKEAVEDHRASRKERPRSLYGCIIAEADRDLDPLRIVERCVDFELSAHPEDTEKKHRERILSHLEEKYGVNGYLKCWLETKKNREGLDQIHRWQKSGEMEAIADSILQKKKVRVTTLCYLEKDGCWLMLNRNKKKNDYNGGKWIGIGGKVEKNESVEECLVREVKEESGLDLFSWHYYGVIRFVSDIVEDMHLFSSADFKGELKECDEGTLAWIKKEDAFSLPLWEGDREFLRDMLEGKEKISMELIYEDEQLKEVLTRESGKEEREQAREGRRENALQFLIFKKIRTIN